ncbi:1-deoxy-D-xylulose-5-phosphate synthase [Pontibacter sp. G13]|uniref:1-deoxy-D-xylulose-5-phosphate synthase n=1 Tax=Pontibacter sp. G13 TaxID=3074898 RepID=UPI00288BF01B|nr:1-deoxy-D-xylulose-5-phosphate synthase [Pontibacter sp. G13]WNJ21290.1 1-deoxy-D-xylulose-5-phosphate synthase [Pontibacter sp. G13]
MPDPIKIQPKELLAQVVTPEDLRKLKPEQLYDFSQELRDFIISTVSVNGGHFGASLGVVELTTAIHYVYNTPYDQLIWDVGHQAYGHKIITGRREDFHTNRRYNGVSGFPKRSESEYDTFGVGHSSTSISAGVGMAIAKAYKGEDDRKIISVIGDGALTGGIAFEGLNHGGWEDTDILVILNDNNMSIDPNVGALKEYLTDITTSNTYNKLRDEVWNLLGKIDKVGDKARAAAAKIEQAVMAANRPGMLFEALGYRYFGPIDGHDVNHLVRILDDLKKIPGPKLLHCVTVKGKGYELAEKDQTKWHAPGTFDKITGEIHKPTSHTPSPPKYQDVFGRSIIELAKENEKIMGVTPAMPSGCSMKYMLAEMPERAFDVGIAEQHAVTFSAGLATQGLVPFCNIYSSFMQRAYDQVIHDVAIQNLHVVFCLDRGGLVGADGSTHHGAYDMAFFRCIPNMVVSAPMNEQELRNLMHTAANEHKGPFSIRYPRGKGVMVDWQTPFEVIPVGKGRELVAGEEVAILTIGHPGNFATEAIQELNAEGIHPGHYDMRFVKPLDEELLHEVFSKYDKVITVEDGCIMGGFGSAIVEFMADHGYATKVKRLGVPDRFVDHGTQGELWAECGYDKQAIVEAVKDWVTVRDFA